MNEPPLDRDPMDHHPYDPLPSPRHLVLMAVIVEGGLGVLAVLLGWWWDCPPGAAIELDGRDALWGVAAALPVFGLLWITLELPFPPFAGLRRVADELLVPMFRDCRALELVVISVLAGVGEEMLFRGVIQLAVADRYGGPLGVWAGLAVASVLFGLAHAITRSYAVVAAVMGLYLGWLLVVSGNLLVPVTAHAAYDFVALVYLVKFREQRREGRGKRGREDDREQEEGSGGTGESP